MKTVLSYLKEYWKDHFHAGLYLSVAIFLAVCTWLNYKFDFEDSVIDAYSGTMWHWLYMSLFMSFPFLIICLLLYFFDINRKWISSQEFWILFFVGFVVLGFSRSFYWHREWIHDLPHIDYQFARKVLWRAKSFFTIFIPILLFYHFYERKRDPEAHWYGLTFKNTDFKPYLVLLILVFVGIGLASFLSDLTNYYPRYLKTNGPQFAEAHHLHRWVPMLLYESTYGYNFLNVELFFRGFLVIGFIRVLGGHAVLAMAGSYMFLHYGKPMTEAISSVFGGYLIGILAFYSKRIWGGVILHVALAWSMELFAWLQRAFNPQA